MDAHVIDSLESLTQTYSSDYTHQQWQEIEKSYRIARQAHEGQFRRSGKPYITHPVGVAAILCSLKMDHSSVVSALLHDTVEDTKTSLDDISKEFGPVVSHLVDGVTKISKIKFHSSHEKQSENIRKVIISMGKDVRVILIKLADRLHNMRELTFLPAQKQKRISTETLEIYVPLASRLGIKSIQIELEDLCLKYLYPKHYENLHKKTQDYKGLREELIKESISKVEERLKEGVKFPFTIEGRSKNLYSIYKKMTRKSVSFEHLNDTLALRVCVDKPSQCYEVLYYIHSLWKPIYGGFKDFIALPKTNGYQSLHTAVIGPKAERMEVQIRTYEMHRIAEYGVAAHWLYKENNEVNKDYVDNFAGLRSLVGYHAGNSSFSDEFLEGIKEDLMEGEIYVFTPKGTVKEFPEKATLIDFAYSIHTDLGNRLDHGIVDGVKVPFNYELKSGDIIYIQTDENQAPSKSWFNYCTTSRAKSAIRQFIREQERHEYKELGRILISQHFNSLGQDFKESFGQEGVPEKVLSYFKMESEFELFTALGFGKLDVSDVFYFMNPNLKDSANLDEKEQGDEKTEFEKVAVRNESDHRVFVTGAQASLAQLQSCCNPIPGDSIVGYWGPDRSVRVHQAECSSVHSHLPENRVRVEWAATASDQRSYLVKLKVICEDYSGLLKNMSEAFTKHKINIVDLDIEYASAQAYCIFSFRIKHVDQVVAVSEEVLSIDHVISVDRL